MEPVLGRQDRHSRVLKSESGRAPIQGMSKFFNTRQQNQILANTGDRSAKHLTSHVLRRILREPGCRI